MTLEATKTILLVEDEPITAAAESETIRQFGYDVLIANNGGEAIGIATGTAEVDLVLMDIDLGRGMDGTEAAKRILEKKNVPIVFLTAHGERGMVERVQGITRYGYVIKNSGDFVLQSSIEMALELFDAHQKISESESRLRALVQTIPDLVWLKDADGVYLACNPRFEDFFGAREAEIVGKTDYDFVNKEMADFFRDHDRCAMAAGKPTMNEEWIRFASDGRKALLETIKTPMFGKDGKLIGVLGIGRDITERTIAEEALRSSEGRMKAIVDGSPIPQFVINKNHRVTHWNRALEEYSKFRAEDMIGTDQHWRAFYIHERPCMADLIVDGMRDMIFQLYPNISQKSNLIDDAYEGADYFPTMKGGSWLQFTAAPIHDEGGDIIGAVETLNDITEQKLVEEALEKRLLALTRPLDDTSGIEFEELFNIVDIQRLQDEFAVATGVASIITHPDGTPITRPSNFCRLCIDVIRKTEKGLMNCYRSDSELGRFSTSGPAIQPCMSGGLWDAGAGITVGGRHVANWLIGQVRDETQSEEKMCAYAREIGADEKEAAAAFREVTAMSHDQFRNIAQFLYTLANQLSAIAYQNVQQARFITESKKAEESLRRSESDYRSVVDNIQDVFYRSDLQGNLMMASPSFLKLLGYESINECLGRPIAGDYYFYPEKRAELLDRIKKTGSVTDYEVIMKRKDGRPVIVETSSHLYYDGGGNVAGVEGVFRDITVRKKVEDSLRDSLAEKDVILKELYHRTKNNMQVICSMLNLRAADIKDAAAQDIYRDIQSKIQTMALVHQKLYDSQELSNLNLKEYADGIVDLMLSNNELSPSVVKIHRSVDAIPISIDTAMPLGLVLNELIANSMKHAFPDNREGEIWIDMHFIEDGIRLEYRDNGIGLPAGYDPAKAHTLGMNIIRNLSRMQLGGDLRFMDEKGFGCTITMGTKLYRRRM